MAAPPDLKFVSAQLSQPPFSRTYTAIQLHDDVPIFQLMQTLSDVIAAIDEGNPQSPHQNVDMRNEDPQDSVARMGGFLALLKWKEAGDMYVAGLVESNVEYKSL